MARPRRTSVASETSLPDSTQELGSMYDYLAKVILLGPSGAGKSCLLHRFLKNEWRILSSQTIGVEFASKIIKIGTGPRRKRIKLQLWDTAGTERFRSVSRSYYRGAAGAILVYDVASSASFDALPTFLLDARALASPNLTLLLAGNKQDLTLDRPTTTTPSPHDEAAAAASLRGPQPETPSSISSKQSSFPFDAGGGGGASFPTNPSSSIRSPTTSTTTKQTATTAPPFGREVAPETASRWASKSSIPVSVEVSALSGENVDALFERLARMILTKIELGEVDPDDGLSGIQYGDVGTAGEREMWSVKAGEEEGGLRRRVMRGTAPRGWRRGLREWEDVFRIPGVGVGGPASGRRGATGCC